MVLTRIRTLRRQQSYKIPQHLMAVNTLLPAEATSLRLEPGRVMRKYTKTPTSLTSAERGAWMWHSPWQQINGKNASSEQGKGLRVRSRAYTIRSIDMASCEPAVRESYLVCRMPSLQERWRRSAKAARAIDSIWLGGPAIP